MTTCQNCRQRAVEPLEDGSPGVLCWPCIIGDVDAPAYRVSDPVEPATVTRENYWLAGVNDLSREPK